MKILKMMALLALVHSSQSVAMNEGGHERFKLDRVSFTLSEKQWVTTTTAKLSVEINASLSNNSLVDMRNKMITKLNTIAKGDWHITQFNRTQDSSGLEKLFARAEARVAQNALTNVNVNAKKISQPGTKYSVSNIDFTPSLEEKERVKQSVRDSIYKAANAEIATLNKQYPNQKYTLNRLVFIPPGQTSPRRYKEANTMMLAAAKAPAVSVSNEIRLNAFVSVASNRDEND